MPSGTFLPPGITTSNVKISTGGSDNQVLTAVDGETAQGEANLTFDGTDLVIASGSLQVRTIDYSDGDNAITIADGGGVTFAQAVDLGSNTLTSTGSMQIRTIDYSDGDLAMTIADGGGVTFAGTASSLTHPAAVVDIKPSFTGTSGSSTGIQLHPTFTDTNADVHFGTHIKYTYADTGTSQTQPSARAVWIEDSAVTGTGNVVTSMVGLWIDNFNSGASSSGTSLYIEGGGTYAIHVDSGTSRFDGTTVFYDDVQASGSDLIFTATAATGTNVHYVGGNGAGTVLEDDTKFTFGMANGGLFTVTDSHTRYAGVFAFSYASSTVVEISDPDSKFVTTNTDSGNLIAVYTTSNSHVVTVANYTGGNQTLRVYAHGDVYTATAKASI
tara:strand:+ start:40 stop:1194 length:1155 start_codon:yes stop_codon:yes gene_type:complete